MTTLMRLCAEYTAHATRYYVRADRSQSGEAANIRCTLRFLLERVGGHTALNKLNRRDLVDFIDAGIRDHDWSRGYANAQLRRVKHMLRWAALDREMIGIEAVAPLLNVPCVQPVRGGAREPEPRHVPSLADAWRVIRRMPREHREVLTLVALTGARLGEIIDLRVRDVAADHLRLTQHKNAHRGHLRLIPIAGEAQAIIRRRCDKANNVPGARLFPPLRAGGVVRSKNRLRVALAKACDTEGTRLFSPHALRHAVAREVRQAFGIDAAQALLGHKSPTMTAHYAPVPIESGRMAAEAIADRFARASRVPA